MTTRRSFVLAAVLAILATFTAPPAARAEDGGARAFLQQLGNDTIATFSDKSLTREQAVEKFRGFLHRGFDVPYIGRWVLGRYWNQASVEEQAEYLKLFEGLIVETYANRFADYKGETFRIASSRPEGEEDTSVQTQITRPDGPPVLVEWRVRHRDGQYRIIDVAVEGVSMGITQRSEFASVIQSSGGVAGLIQALKKRVSQS